MTGVPDGFVPLATRSPFNLSVGPLYCREQEGMLVMGLRVEERHCNSAGRLHGAMVCAIADVTLGHNVGLALAGQDRPLEAVERQQASGVAGAPVATVSMSTDFAGTASKGDWVEARADVQRAGGTLAFANAYLVVGERRIARTSAVFKILR